MPILTDKITYNFRKNKTTQENMEKFNLIYPFGTDVEIPVLDLKLITPKKSNIHIECQCDSCGKKFTKTLLRTNLEDIKNNHIICNVCIRKATNQKKFGRDYPFAILTSEKIARAKEREQAKENSLLENIKHPEKIKEQPMKKKKKKQKRKDS